MQKKSAGILAYRFVDHEIQFFLAHPGGPFWKNKDDGVWSIPKGEFSDDEEPLKAALREFTEETGVVLTQILEPLGSVRMKSGKLIYAWACLQDIDAGKIRSNEFEIEWPPKSGKMQKFPEIDKCGWFTKDEASTKIIGAQLPLIERVMELHKK